MITPPSNWSTIYGQPGSILEFRAVVDLVAGIQQVFTESQVSSSGFMFEKRLFDKWSVGNAISAHLSFTAIDAAAEIPIMTEGQRCVFECRAVNGNNATSWVQLGVFYVDSIDVNGDSASISAFDAMYRLDVETPVFNADITLGNYASLLATTCGDSTLLNSPLLNEYYAKVTSGTTTTTAQLRTLVLPASLSGESARNIIASAAALAGGNAVIDNNGVLRLVKIDATSTNYNPGTISLYCGDEKRYFDNLRFSQFFIANKADMASGLGNAIGANVLDKLLVDDGYYVTQLNTAELISKVVFTSTKKYIEDSSITIDNAEISPLVELRDQVSYTDISGNAHTFRINGFRLNCSGWSVGELSTQVNPSDIELKLISLYRTSTGWDDPTWYAVSSSSVSFDSVNQSYVAIESEKSFQVRLQFSYSNATLRFNGQRYRFHINYAYTSSGQIRNVDITCYAFPDVYTCSNAGSFDTRYVWVRFVCDNFPAGINLRQPLSARMYCDDTIAFENLVYQARS